MSEIVRVYSGDSGEEATRIAQLLLAAADKHGLDPGVVKSFNDDGVYFEVPAKLAEGLEVNEKKGDESSDEGGQGRRSRKGK